MVFLLLLLMMFLVHLSILNHHLLFGHYLRELLIILLHTLTLWNHGFSFSLLLLSLSNVLPTLFQLLFGDDLCLFHKQEVLLTTPDHLVHLLFRKMAQ